ncbi:GGDEF domain-containing protein [Sandaracinobacter sp. RS1-74]|uniref:GGDEF domain-containing protein n=1 Tax=Sandaracinobacteroides sayramensis TaxID=2913411 RepID=UPI001EDA23CA|nr:GGDEF domain-containing protein [Sandaracinobacteroides sayramensis]MCG2839790.1 GGDEF domain-containing protein [Sandaracinobacteroides sayramensis]
MEQTGQLQAVREAGARDHAGPHPELLRFDAVRDLLLRTGLAPEPETYELLYLHVGGADAALCRGVERALLAGELGPEQVKALRRAHLGDIAGAELLALVEAAQESAVLLAERLDRGHSDLRAYDAAIAAEDEALRVSRTAHELADMVQRLRRANAQMMAVNRRLEADMKETRLETGRLLDRLESAERTARTDPLTGLLNRRGLLEALKRAQARALREGVPLAVGLVDVDHFKRVNDLWGHAIGDEVLRCVGGHLQGCARRTAGERAFAGRHGGEEFLVALPGLTLAEAAAALDGSRAILARQLLRRADDGVSLGRISFSAGVAQLRAGDSPESLIDRADAALYAAKRAGRDRVLPERSAG